MPEIPGTQGGGDGAFFIDPESLPDYTDLAKPPPVTLKPAHRFEQHGAETVGQVTVENPGQTLAFLLHLGVTKGPNGQEVSPWYWSDNYFSLLPGEKRALTVRFATDDLAGALEVRVAGWR